MKPLVQESQRVEGRKRAIAKPEIKKLESSTKQYFPVLQPRTACTPRNALGSGLTPRGFAEQPRSPRPRSGVNMITLFNSGMGVDTPPNRVGERRSKLAAAGCRSQRALNRLRDASISGAYSSRIVFDYNNPNEPVNRVKLARSVSPTFLNSYQLLDQRTKDQNEAKTKE